MSGIRLHSTRKQKLKTFILKVCKRGILWIRKTWNLERSNEHRSEGRVFILFNGTNKKIVQHYFQNKRGSKISSNKVNDGKCKSGEEDSRVFVNLFLLFRRLLACRKTSYTYGWSQQKMVRKKFEFQTLMNFFQAMQFYTGTIVNINPFLLRYSEPSFVS